MSRRLSKTLRKLKSLTLNVGLAATLLVAPAVRAAEYTYDGANSTGTYDAPSGTGSQATSENKGNYLNIGSVSGSDWFESFVGNNALGLWRTDSDNRLIVVYGSYTKPLFFFGGVAANGTDESAVSGNEIHHSGGSSSTTALIGGLGAYGAAVGNKIYYYGGGIGSGLQYKLTVLNRSTTLGIIGGAVLGDGAGTDADNLKAAENEVYITGSGDIRSYTAIVGGAVLDENSAGSIVTENKINISSYTGTIWGDVIGGWALSGDVTKNKIEISNINKTILNSFYLIGVAGGLTNSGDASENEVEITNYNGNINEYLYGGATDYGDATDNHVTVTDSATYFTGAVGGNSEHGSANDNTVTITNTKAGTSYPAITTYYVYGGYASYGNANGNTVTIEGVIEGSDYKTFITQNIYGGYRRTETGQANENNVYINDSITRRNIYGGYASSGSSVANGNAISVENSKIQKAVSGLGIYGGYSSGQEGAASDNEISVQGSAVQIDIVGGKTTGANSAANENQITIANSTVAGNVYGAAVGSSSTARGNIVTLLGDITVDGSASSLCGYDDGGYYQTNHAGNTLNAEKVTQTGVWNEIGNFDQYNFLIDYDNIVAAGGALADDNFALSAASVYMGGATVESIEITDDEMRELQDGDQLGLLKAEDDFQSEIYSNKPEIIQVAKSLSTLYEFDLELKSRQLTATYRIRANPTTKALAEGYLAGPDFLNRGADLIEKEAFKEAGVQAWREHGPAIFAAMGYSDVRHDTGSHIDVKGPSLVVGLATAKETANGSRLTWGGFLEAGWGSYDSYNSFGGTDEVRGEGDTNYYGLGFLARQDHARRGAEHVYAEGSLRIGQVKTDFTSDLGNSGTNARYNAKSVYYGLHIGAGYIQDLKGGASIDFYGKLLYSRTGGDSLNVLGEPVEFDAVNSLRFRAGARYGKEIKAKSSFYAGLSYEHEFNGKAKGTAGGWSIAAPDIKGGTGLGEIGVIFKGKRSQIDLKAEGYAGKRKGIGLSAAIKWFF